MISALVLRNESILGFVTMASLLGTAMLFPLGFLEHGYRDIPSWGAQAWLAASFLGVISTVVAFLILFWAVSRFGAGLGAMAVVIVLGVRLAARRAPAVGATSHPGA